MAKEYRFDPGEKAAAKRGSDGIVFAFSISPNRVAVIS
jgi:hypothetical protein